MQISLSVATTHLTGRLRATLVSLGGIVLGVAFFLAVSSLMRGSEQDFLKRLIDNNPHITVYDEYRNPEVQPAQLRWADGAVQVSHVKPHAEPRGIRAYRQKLDFVESLPGVRVAPVLTDSAVLLFAGHQEGVIISGIVPAKMKAVTTIEEKIVEGSLDALAADSNGIVLGTGLAQKFNLHLGSTVSVVTASGTSHALRVVGFFAPVTPPTTKARRLCCSSARRPCSSDPIASTDSSSSCRTPPRRASLPRGLKRRAATSRCRGSRPRRTS